ncbi:hypothetical protein BZA70DRAFT_276256 [Myxozyma melibiosi]|uniref:Protein HGH1 homolog n=1 Tax=Myxozyma melibiosi TaxID=54550 RepID=A0ABR1F8Y0_9ASCO
MPTEIEELVEFLHSPQPMIRNIALQNLVGFSSGPQNTIFLQDNLRPIKDLQIIAMSKDPSIVKDALTILANMSEYIKIRKMLAENEMFVTYVVQSIVKPDEPNADLFCVLLANIAKDDAIAGIFKIKATQTSADLKSHMAIDQLVDCFVKGAEKKLNKKATFDYLAFVFADISRLNEGRKYFSTAQSYDDVVPLSKLLVFTEYDNDVRRAGVASTIKNTLFELSEHINLLDQESVNILPYLLLPLAGPEDLPEDELDELPEELQLLPPDKTREKDHEIICVHVESLVLLGATQYGRDFMRSTGVYPIVRELHLAVEDENVREICERFVQLIMADEPNRKSDEQRLQITEGEEEESAPLEVIL